MVTVKFRTATSVVRLCTFIYRVIKSLCVPDVTVQKSRKIYFKHFQLLTMVT
jgi:hypothetical protein